MGHWLRLGQVKQDPGNELRRYAAKPLGEAKSAISGYSKDKLHLGKTKAVSKDLI